MRKTLGLALLMSCINASAGAALSSLPTPTGHMKLLPISTRHHRQLRVRPFHSIHVLGAAHIILHYTPGRFGILEEAGKGLSHLKARVKHKTLSIKGPAGINNKQLPVVEINYPLPLRHLAIDGVSDIAGTGIQARHLSIMMSGPGRISLSGHLNLKKIWQSGGSFISLRGISSRHISLRLSELATTELQGRAYFLSARLRNSAQLQAEKLTAKNVFLDSTGNSVARVKPMVSLRAYAKNQADIFYYHRPQFHTLSTVQSANIIPMGW